MTSYEFKVDYTSDSDLDRGRYKGTATTAFSTQSAVVVLRNVVHLLRHAGYSTEEISYSWHKLQITDPITSLEESYLDVHSYEYNRKSFELELGLSQDQVDLDPEDYNKGVF